MVGIYSDCSTGEMKFYCAADLHQRQTTISAEFCTVRGNTNSATRLYFTHLDNHRRTLSSDVNPCFKNLFLRRYAYVLCKCLTQHSNSFFPCLFSWYDVITRNSKQITFWPFF